MKTKHLNIIAAVLIIVAAVALIVFSAPAPKCSVFDADRDGCPAVAK